MTSGPSAQAFVVYGAFIAAVAVGAGAFGTHTLAPHLTPARLATFETGARYAMYHALGLIALGTLMVAWPDAAVWLRRAGYLFAIGVVLFSGSLWLLVLTGITAFGIITPVGGLCFITGWVLFAFAVLSTRKTPGSV